MYAAHILLVREVGSRNYNLIIVLLTDLHFLPSDSFNTFGNKALIMRRMKTVFMILFKKFYTYINAVFALFN